MPEYYYEKRVPIEMKDIRRYLRRAAAVVVAIILLWNYESLIYSVWCMFN